MFGACWQTLCRKHTCFVVGRQPRSWLALAVSRREGCRDVVLPQKGSPPEWFVERLLQMKSSQGSVTCPIVFPRRHAVRSGAVAAGGQPTAVA